MDHESVIAFRSSTDEILRRVVRKDTSPLVDLFREKGTRLMALIACRLTPALKRRMEPEDVFQEVYIEAARQYDMFEDRGEGSLFAWVAKIAEYKLRSLEQHAAAQKRSPWREARGGNPWEDSGSTGELSEMFLADQTSPSQAAIRWETFERVVDTLSTLPDREREVLVRRCFHECSTEEVASQLGITAANVHTILSRTRKKLRDLLDVC